MTRRILISGASIAGCATAWWLGQNPDLEVSVVEKAPQFRDGGQNIDVRGAGRAVLRRMGLEEAALAQGTGEKGTAWIHEDGSVIAQIDTDELGADGPTAEMEILRGDLARLLFDGARAKAEFRFGETITALEQDAERVSVTFASGKQEDFDLLIIAEGVGSSTRDLAFPGENDPRPLDLTLAYFTVPREPHDDQLWRWYHTTHGRGVSLRPDRQGTARAMLSFQKPPEGEERWEMEQQKAWLREQFGDVGWEAPRLLRALAGAEDFYFDVLRQVRMPRWSDGRVALTGDAAWCVTPLGGVGATLALVGAYVLAGELSKSQSDEQAFSAYREHLQSFVEKAQDIKKIVPRIANPHSRLGLAFLYGTVKLASAPGIKDLFAKALASRSDDIDLPEYEFSREPIGN
jgi:2-polyprenyl-6-methoxyphenol hydroxylase-like FAD-dependent oxidoreductase